VNDVLVTYLGTIDKQLLFYLDEDDEMMFDTVERLRSYTSALLDGWLTPAHLVEEWPDWYALATAFVFAYGTEELGELQDAATLLREHHEVGLTESDRAYLVALGTRLDMYPEIRNVNE
jgi:hypothetical protein